MRRTCALGIYAALLLLVPTTNAYAWWEFVESLSGPGRWTGPGYRRSHHVFRRHPIQAGEQSRDGVVGHRARRDSLR